MEYYDIIGLDGILISFGFNLLLFGLTWKDIKHHIRVFIANCLKINMWSICIKSKDSKLKNTLILYILNIKLSLRCQLLKPFNFFVVFSYFQLQNNAKQEMLFEILLSQMNVVFVLGNLCHYYIFPGVIMLILNSGGRFKICLMLMFNVAALSARFFFCGIQWYNRDK